MIDFFFLQVIDNLRVCNRQPIAVNLFELDEFCNIDSGIDIILIKEYVNFSSNYFIKLFHMWQIINISQLCLVLF